MRKNKKNAYLYLLVSLAMLSAVSIVCGKYLAFNIGGALRFSFENMPILFASIAFGPLAGFAVALISDVVGSVMVGYTVLPVVTLGACAVGAGAGIVSLILGKRFKPLNIIIASAAAHLLGSVIIKSVGLYYAGFAMGLELFPFMLLRLGNYAIIVALEASILIGLFKSRGIMDVINDINKRTKSESFRAFANSFQAVTVPGLERISALLKKLGNPDKSLRFIHIAGTNGKGSTSANMACILEEAGYKTGKFISPNLLRVNERISVNGTDISDADMNAILSLIEPLAKEVEREGGIAPTQFEIWCALAFVYFEREKCDYVVLEVGLGGEFDATNVISGNVLQIITRLGLDHTQYLGSTISEVAKAKCGIVKESSALRTLITVEQEAEAMRVIEECSREKNTELVVAKPESLGALGVYERFWLDGAEYETGIPGFHQIENASLAILAARKMGICEDAIKRGVKRAKNPARFEIIRENPFVIYDGGHNENGITALNFTLHRYFGDAPKTVIFACMRDKEIEESLRLLSANDTEFIYTTVKNNERAATAEELLKKAEALGYPGMAFEDIKDAYREAVSRNKLTVICGSLYLYKDFREFYDKELK